MPTDGAADLPASPRATTIGTAGRARATRGDRVPGHVISLFSFVLGLFAWWAITAAGLVVLPGPHSVALQAVELIRRGQLPNDILASLGRVVTGFLLGVTVAVPVGFLMGWYRVARALIEPYVQFFRMIPPLAVIPLAIVTLGIDEAPKIFVIFLASFLSCVVATYQGVISVDRTLVNAARVLGATNLVLFARVVVPASIPFILVGVRIGLGASWATVVAAELIAAQSGLGARMQQAQLFYDLPTIFVSLVTIGLLGLLMDRLVQLAERRLTGWQERAR